MAITTIPYAREIGTFTDFPNKIAAFDQAGTFTPRLSFDTAGGKIVQRTNAQHTRIGVNTDSSKRPYWLYEGEIRHIVLNVLGKSKPNGLSTFSNADMDTVAAYIASLPYEYVISDYEPKNEAEDGWMWTSYNQPEKINYISQKVKTLTTSGGNYKKYMDWFQSKLFTFGGKTLGLLTNNGTFQSSTGGTTVDDYISCHANPAGATGFADNSSISRLGYGYSSITFKPDNAGGAPYGADVNYFAIPSALKALDSVFLQLAFKPNADIFFVTWFREDQERLNYQQQFKISGSSLGYLRMLDNRLGYPYRISADLVTLVASFKNVKKMHTWIMPTSEESYDMLRYAKRNGQNFCQSDVLGFDLAEYKGPDYASFACPTGAIDFMNPQEVKGFNATVAGLERDSFLSDVLDGTQTPSFPAFRWKRANSSTWNNVAALTDLSGVARAWKNKAPVCFVQTATSGKKVLYFKHFFADAFEEINFECSSLGVSTIVEGNNLEILKIV